MPRSEFRAILVFNRIKTVKHKREHKKSPSERTTQENTLNLDLHTKLLHHLGPHLARYSRLWPEHFPEWWAKKSWRWQMEITEYLANTRVVFRTGEKPAFKAMRKNFWPPIRVAPDENISQRQQHDSAYKADCPLHNYHTPTFVPQTGEGQHSCRHLDTDIDHFPNPNDVSNPCSL